MRVKIIQRNGDEIGREVPHLSRLPNFVNDAQIDLNALASSIFFAEEALQNRHDVSKIRVPLYNSYGASFIDKVEILFEFLFGKHIDLVPIENLQQRLVEDDDTELADATTCLFSNGLDSYTGILNGMQKFDSIVAAFVSHSDQRNLRPLVAKLSNGQLRKNGIEVKTIDAPEHGSYTRVSRGVLYVLDALLLGNKNLIVSEVGPTMYQPRFTLLDSISLTTHPKVMQLVKEIAEIMLSTRIRIIKPHENLTKAEVAALCPFKKMIKITCSCSTTRWANSRYPNCGTCYSCVVRKLSLLSAGVEDSLYRTERHETQTESMVERDNLAHLLRFSVEMLNGFDELPLYETEIITKYGKRSVFERFALDNLAGLMILCKNQPTNSLLQKLNSLASKVISEDELGERIATLRDAKFEPDFSNVV